MSNLLAELRATRETIRAYRQAAEPERLAELTDIVGTLQQQMSDYLPVSAAQQEVIARAIRGLAQRYKQQTGKEIFAQLFAEFTRTLGTPAYDKLPARRYDEAIAWVQQKAAALFPDDPGAVPPMQQSLL
jgi:hypothetical protein